MIEHLSTAERLARAGSAAGGALLAALLFLATSTAWFWSHGAIAWRWLIFVIGFVCLFPLVVVWKLTAAYRTKGEAIALFGSIWLGGTVIALIQDRRTWLDCLRDAGMGGYAPVPWCEQHSIAASILIGLLAALPGFDAGALLVRAIRLLDGTAAPTPLARPTRAALAGVGASLAALVFLATCSSINFWLVWAYIAIPWSVCIFLFAPAVSTRTARSGLALFAATWLAGAAIAAYQDHRERLSCTAYFVVGLLAAFPGFEAVVLALRAVRLLGGTAAPPNETLRGGV